MMMVATLTGSCTHMVLVVLGFGSEHGRLYLFEVLADKTLTNKLTNTLTSAFLHLQVQLRHMVKHLETVPDEKSFRTYVS